MGIFKKYINKYKGKYILALMFLVIEAICDLLQPTIMSKIIDNGVAKNNMNLVLKLGGIMFLVTAIGAVSAIIRNIVSSTVSQKFGTDLRGDLYKKIQDLSLDNINTFHDASLITRLTNDVNQVQNFAHGMMRIFVKAPILCIGSIAMAALINPSMSLVLIGVIPIITFLIIMNMKISYPIFTKIQRALDKVNGVAREYLAGVRVVKAFNRFNYEIERFEGVNKELTAESTKGMRTMAVFNPGVASVVNMGIVLVLWFGGHKVNSGTMHVGQIIAFTNYMTQILFSLMMLSHVFNMFIRAKTSAERIGEVLLEENNLKIKEFPAKLDEIKGKVEFENVTFSYFDTGEPVLKDISFSCNPGETIAIIGSTGSGKSSLVNLIPRFYDTTKGSVKVDGIDVKDMDLKKLREAIAIVPQKTLLFTGTILENIKWGNDKATMEDVETVAKISKAHEFISSFNEGYNTILGQSGVNLSGGQKQRISIARALVRKPKILILDDSTSAVDVATEGEIRSQLKEYLMDTTCILIAQRITSVMNADKILVLDSGYMAGIGSHEELMDRCEVYKDIFRSQIGREGMSNEIQ